MKISNYSAMSDEDYYSRGEYIRVPINRVKVLLHAIVKRVLVNIYVEARGLEAYLEVCRAKGPATQILFGCRTVVHTIKDARLELDGSERD